MNGQMKKLKEHFARLRRNVLKPASGFLKYDYVVPGGYYQELWDWDGFFISTHLAGREVENARYYKNWVLNFLSAADDKGLAPGCLTPKGPEKGHRLFQMKPLIAQGAELASRLLKDYGWLSENYEKIKKVATLRESTNYDAKYGLFFWDSAMQSGADNNPALSNEPDKLRIFLSCDINAFQWREYVALERLAKECDKPEEAEEFRKKADALLDAVNKHLWCEADGTLWNIRRDTGEYVKRVSYSNFVPLWAAMLPKENGRRMIKKYLWNEEHMLSKFGLRSLSKQDAIYNNINMIWPESNWQGPVWLIANYFYFVGLMNYGFRTEAKHLVEMLTALLLKDIEKYDSMHENYDAETGAPIAPSGQSAKGFHEAGFFGWNLLLEDMIEMLEGKENLLALQ